MRPRIGALLIAVPALLNIRVTQPVRRRIEQPSEETKKRNGCLMWGAILGILAGIMVGVYALPPILRHYYGEAHVAADEFYSGDGKAIRIEKLGQASEPLGEAAAGMRREDFFASITVVTNASWSPRPTDFSLQFKGVKHWEQAADAKVNGQPLTEIVPGGETTVELHFVVELPSDAFPELEAEALHLSDPRVRFAIAAP
ncbi:MAG: hypothetical protein ABI577_04655 [bacterium]